MLAGLFAGVLGFGFAQLVGEPQIVRAVAFESGQSERADHDDSITTSDGAHAAESAPVSRELQRTIGLFTGTTVVGVALGGVVAMVYAFARGRVGPGAPRVLALAIATTGFVAGYLVPFLKYPPNPPGVGDPDTIGRRTALYVTMVVVSAAATGVAIAMRRRLIERYGEWYATLLAVGFFTLSAAVAMVVLPEVNELPPGFPADVLWSFRMGSVGQQVVLWVTIGLAFGALAERSQLSATTGTNVQASRVRS